MNFFWLILIFVFILIVFIGIIFIFRDYFDKHQSMSILVAIIAIIVASFLTTVQIDQQNKQQIIDNRPSVFVSGWGEFKQYEDFSTIRMKLTNVGKLPAKFDAIEEKIKLGEIEKNIESPSFEKATVIFPEQENMHLDIPIPKELIPLAVKNKGFTIKIKLTYYSINDINKENKFYYYIEYQFLLDEERTTSTRTSFKDPILQKIDAK